MTLEQVKALSDEELRVKVAELCGWELEREGMVLFENRHYAKGPESLPNYPHDLNAIYEAEKILIGVCEFDRWVNHIIDILGGSRSMRESWAVFNATARQRAEAFVLTMQGE